MVLTFISSVFPPDVKFLLYDSFAGSYEFCYVL